MAIRAETYMKVAKIVNRSKTEVGFGYYDIVSDGAIRYRDVDIKVYDFKDRPEVSSWSEGIRSESYTKIYEGKTDEGKLIFTGIDDYQNCY